MPGGHALIVASTDLSHYPAWRDANAADRRTLEAMATLDADRLRTAAAGAGRSPNLATCACGESAVAAAMVAAKVLGATRGRVVSYANSGDLPIGDPERVVGYGAVVFTPGAPGADASVLLPAAPAAQALPPTPSDKKLMLAVARETIRRYLDTQTVPLARGFSPSLDRPQGVFVTLKKHGELRGCIGQMTPDRPLRVLVGSMALAAAFQDQRFSKVRANELKDLEIEISVLTPFKEVPGPSAIVVGRDGVLLQKDRRSAVFLPQVATEEGWTRDQMLDNLCLKAGLTEGCWRIGAKLSTFQADVFKEAPSRTGVPPVIPVAQASVLASVHPMLLLLVGLLAILSQIVLLRELNVAFYGVELVYALALAVWMVGTAAGSLLPFGMRVSKGRGAGALIVAAAVVLPAEIAVVRGSRVLLGGVPGAYLPFGDQVLVLLASLIPQAAMLGLAFRWAAEEAARRGSSLARSYAVESAGACLGAVAATAGFMAGVQTFTVAVVTAGAVPAMLLMARRRQARGVRQARGLSYCGWRLCSR